MMCQGTAVLVWFSAVEWFSDRYLVWVINVLLLQSFFGLGFGQNIDIDIVLDGQETRKTAEIRAEDGRKERHFLYLDGETVSGKVGFIQGYCIVICSNTKRFL